MDNKKVALFLTRSKSQQKAFKLCHNCAVDKQKDLILKDDAKKHFEQSLHYCNKENLLILLKFLMISKNNFAILAKALIKTLILKFNKVLSDIQFDQIELIHQDRSSILKNYVNYKVSSQSLINQIGNLSKTMFLTKFEQLIQRIEVSYKSEIVNQFLILGY
ncbi:unnamed protein product [Paramecium pentaurelia]|uniref:Uncharacterized protein n=1 Tax=Paramecium pentaurelia TaxID=43138 RepID=A0A8S1WA65_9CILI|nr:unnamed protein product [Paramecium pentaurelia]